MGVRKKTACAKTNTVGEVGAALDAMIGRLTIIIIMIRLVLMKLLIVLVVD